MGLVHFKLAVPNPGDTATVVIYFSEALPEGLAWYKYTPSKGWHSYAEHATIAADGKSVTVELQDGGFGDADGVVNGMIVDPSGVGYVTVANTTSPTAVVSSGGGGGGGLLYRHCRFYDTGCCVALSARCCRQLR